MYVQKPSCPRKRRIEIRVSEEEYLNIEEKAKRCNLNKSDYLRREGLED